MRLTASVDIGAFFLYTCVNCSYTFNYSIDKLPKGAYVKYWINGKPGISYSTFVGKYWNKILPPPCVKVEVQLVYPCGNSPIFTKKHDCSSPYELIKNTSTNSEDFYAYPNPSNDMFTVKWVENLKSDFVNGKLIVTDLQGKLIQSQIFPSGTNRLFIDSSNFESGIYILKLQLDDFEKVIRTAVVH